MGLWWAVAGVIATALGVVVAAFVGFLQLRQGRDRHLIATRRMTAHVLPAPVARLPVRVVGRDAVVRELATLAKRPDGRVQVLVGLGGSGKSTIALDTVRKAGRGRIRGWWVPAPDQISVTQALLGLAEELGAPESEVRAALEGRLNPSDVLWPRLEATPRWILVLDNADDISALSAAGRRAPDGAGWLRSTQAGLILITSRLSDPDVWGRLANVRPVAPLASADGAQLLRDLAPDAGDSAEAEALSARLGSLPLALAQAGHYLRSAFSEERSFTAYLRALSDKFGQLMSGDDDVRTDVISTWDLSLAALEAQGRDLARPLLLVLACFAAPVVIPYLLLDRNVLERQFGEIARIRAGLAGLHQVGLIDLDDSPGEDHWPSVSLHPLLAETMRHTPGTAFPRSAALAVDLLGAAASHLEDEDPRAWTNWLSLLPHLQELLKSRITLPVQSIAILAAVAADMTVALERAGAHQAATDLATSALQRCIVIGPEQPEILRLRFSLATALMDQGRAPEALTKFQEIRDAQLKVLGPDHSDTLTTRHQLATALTFLGDYATAESEFRDIINKRTRILGPDHPHTLTTRHQLANVLADQYRFTEAEAEYRQLLSARERVLGATHIDTLNNRHQVAYIMLETGKLTEAEAEYRDVLQKRLKFLDPNHYVVLANRHEIGRALLRQGQFAAAEDEFRRVLVAKLAGALTPDHPDTFTTRHAIGLALAAQGRSGEAEAEFRAVLADRMRVLGPDHPQTLTSRHEIAVNLAAQGKLAEAETELRQVLADRMRVLGPDHPDTKNSEHWLKKLTRSANI